MKRKVAMKGHVLHWVNGHHGVNAQQAVEGDLGRKPESALIIAISFTMKCLATHASQFWK